MNAHKIIQYALIFSIAVPAIERVWYYVRWKLIQNHPRAASPPLWGGQGGAKNTEK